VQDGAVGSIDPFCARHEVDEVINGEVLDCDTARDCFLHGVDVGWNLSYDVAGLYVFACGVAHDTFCRAGDGHGAEEGGVSVSLRYVVRLGKGLGDIGGYDGALHGVFGHVVEAVAGGEPEDFDSGQRGDDVERKERSFYRLARAVEVDKTLDVVE